MSNCPVCKRDTPPVKIGGQLYCSVCGTPAASVNFAPKRLSLDLSPRARGPQRQAARQPAPQAPPAEYEAVPASRSTSAADLHRRVKTSAVLDLRDAASLIKAAEISPASHQLPAAPPKSTTRERHLAHLNGKLEMAKQVGRSPMVQKFHPGHGSQQAQPAAAEIYQAPAQPGNFPAQQPHPAYTNREAPHELPKSAVTHHEALAKLAANAPVPASSDGPGKPLTSPYRPHLKLSPHAGRVATTVAAAAIMSGYIWVQNYPKLALQNASSQAGLTASLPAYLPSSYTLKNTQTQPGLVTLSFGSPSASETLKIEQHRTSWDSSSLLDNYVAKATDDYSTVQGQGLTIYLFNNNQAAWVNHGIRYSIAGAGRLSREQILKIAYSL